MTTVDLMMRRAAAAAIVAIAAREALVFFERRNALDIAAKRPQDFVSEADRDIETLVRRLLAERFEGEAVVGEEQGGDEARAYWIIDPIDGTSNFLAGSPLWGVSLGYVVDGDPIVGAVAAPVLGIAMAAAKGLGLLKDGEPYARPAGAADLRLVSVGDSLDDDIDAMLTLHGRLRRAGWVVECFHSTSVSMLFAALGRFDGHIQPRTTLWDIAGGVAICREAGLRVDVERHAAGGYGVRAGTPPLLAALATA